MGSEYAVLTCLGTDRVGIMEDIAAGIESAGCNIEESRASVLGGEFAVIMLISGEAGQIKSLIRDQASLSDSTGLAVTVKPTVPPKPSPQGRPYVVESFSLDAPGIVHLITERLGKYGVNIDDLESDTTAAPFTGAPMFIFKARVTVPPECSLAELRDHLEELSHEKDLDIALKPVAPTPAE
jgi:glycine cleavage system transcriptional repressor